jgi:hypothetical protein
VKDKAFQILGADHASLSLAMLPNGTKWRAVYIMSQMLQADIIAAYS